MRQRELIWIWVSSSKPGCKQKKDKKIGGRAIVVRLQNMLSQSAWSMIPTFKLIKYLWPVKQTCQKKEESVFL